MITREPERVRVLYSFPHKIGAARICTTAWYQVAGVAAAGAEVLVFPGAIHKPLPSGIRVRPTLGRGRLRIPYRLLGRLRALELHDRIVARRLGGIAQEVDVVHVWPLAARHTLASAKALGVPTVLERPNAHTRLAYEVVRAESDRLRVPLPPDHEHAYNEEVLRREEEEYRMADYLLCPSDFVIASFVEEGFQPGKLLRHDYGFDPSVYFPGDRLAANPPGLTVLFAGVAAVRKGLHFALEAWSRSSISEQGRFMIAGAFLPAYRDHLSAELDRPSVEMLGYRTDVPDLMRRSDALVLPSLEEGSALVCAEAMACGCVPLVSDAASGHAKHMVNALIHRAGDVETLAEHMTLLQKDRSLLRRLKAGALASAPDATWESAGRTLLAAYEHAVRDVSR